jgi:hypothetical protein
MLGSTSYLAAVQLYGNTKKDNQWGGVGIPSMTKAAHRVANSGTDKTGMGRWTWTRFRGRNNVMLRIITGYRPHRNLEGAQSVYEHLHRYKLPKIVLHLLTACHHSSLLS